MTHTVTDAEMCRMLDDVWRNDDLCHAAEWAELDRRLASVDVSGMHPAVMLTWLMVTNRGYVQGHLSEWVPRLLPPRPPVPEVPGRRPEDRLHPQRHGPHAVRLVQPDRLPAETTVMTTPLKDLTFSEQKGPPGHCFGAQVWGPDGQSVAVIESTDDPANATSFARLFALSPRLLAFARDIATNYDHEGRDECYRGCRVCAAEALLAEYEASKPVHPGET